MISDTDIPVEKPIVIADLDYSKEPFHDRGKLVNLIESLAKKVVEVLKADRQLNKRNARRMVLSNKSSSNGKRDDFIIDLPNSKYCWNESDNVDIQIEIVRKVEDFSEVYTWYKVKIFLGEFFNDEVRSVIHDLEERDREKEANERKKRRLDALKRQQNSQAKPIETQIDLQQDIGVNVGPVTVGSTATTQMRGAPNQMPNRPNQVPTKSPQVPPRSTVVLTRPVQVPYRPTQIPSIPIQKCGGPLNPAQPRRKSAPKRRSVVPTSDKTTVSQPPQPSTGGNNDDDDDEIEIVYETRSANS